LRDVAGSKKISEREGGVFQRSHDFISAKAAFCKGPTTAIAMAGHLAKNLGAVNEKPFGMQLGTLIPIFILDNAGRF